MRSFFIFLFFKKTTPIEWNGKKGTLGTARPSRSSSWKPPKSIRVCEPCESYSVGLWQLTMMFVAIPVLTAHLDFAVRIDHKEGACFRMLSPFFLECSYCGVIGIRKKESFICKNKRCQSCNIERHADVNSAFNIGKRSLQQGGSPGQK